jgi:hypothetical protein
MKKKGRNYQINNQKRQGPWLKLINSATLEVEIRRIAV